jgi:hypothetical protein
MGSPYGASVIEHPYFSTKLLSLRDNAQNELFKSLLYAPSGHSLCNIEDA